MAVRYYLNRHGHSVPEYRCQQQAVARAEPLCQHFVGATLDRAIGDLLVETVTPIAIEAAIAVKEALHARADEADRLRRQQVERARYEAELAQRRYLRVDPDHRLVAESLEADWNHKLRALADAQEDYRRRSEAEGDLLGENQRQELATLAADFPRLWHDPDVLQRERKRMVRLLIEDVTLLRTDEIVAQVRFRGGATHTLRLPLPLPAPLLRKTHPDVVSEVDRLLEDHTDAEIATILNGRGIRPALGEQFTSANINHIRYAYGLQNLFTRLRAAGMLTTTEVAARLGVHPQTVRAREREGLLPGHVYDDKGSRLYEPPPDQPQKACQWCNKQFITTWAKPGRRPKWCSSRCMYAAYRARKRASTGPASQSGEDSSTHLPHEVQSVA